VLAAQTGQALVHPVFFGSAITGAGVESLMSGIAELLPAAAGDVDSSVSGTVFKIERSRAGEKIAYVRLFSGVVRTRDRLLFGRQTLETVVVPRRPADKGALHVALTQLAEQDPLINLRQDDLRQELFVSLYGEVQKEVIQATLANDFNIDVGFRETTPICIERPIGAGAAGETLGKAPNPFLATVGLRIDPAATNSGVEFRLEAELGSIPLFLYKAVEDFRKAVEETVQKTLREGIYGWQVTDCTVTMTHSGYRSPGSTAGDFRNLTPLVLMSALKQAGTAVCEPIHGFHLDAPADTLGPVLRVLARLEAVPHPPAVRDSSYTLEGQVPAARVHELQRQLRALTRGEGVLECAFDCYRPVSGMIPTRPRSDHNPLNRKEYLLHVVRRV
jgi:ribosomal protection tetracycline resistance protein